MCAEAPRDRPIVDGATDITDLLGGPPSAQLPFLLRRYPGERNPYNITVERIRGRKQF